MLEGKVSEALSLALGIVHADCTWDKVTVRTVYRMGGYSNIELWICMLIRNFCRYDLVNVCTKPGSVYHADSLRSRDDGHGVVLSSGILVSRRNLPLVPLKEIFEKCSSSFSLNTRHGLSLREVWPGSKAS